MMKVLAFFFAAMSLVAAELLLSATDVAKCDTMAVLECALVAQRDISECGLAFVSKGQASFAEDVHGSDVGMNAGCIGALSNTKAFGSPCARCLQDYLIDVQEYLHGTAGRWSDLRKYLFGSVTSAEGMVHILETLVAGVEDVYDLADRLPEESPAVHSCSGEHH
ncbi:hypothetical protein BKA62DRAFT_814436 [Auriculariales sp. MPI-PUGE-AT-0066]|nr:hypothetical protein BKA62DRAFT_814436 [Auriculariales sp. MPI-PUGE-AT-0066]